MHLVMQFDSASRLLAGAAATADRLRAPVSDRERAFWRREVDAERRRLALRAARARAIR